MKKFTLFSEFCEISLYGRDLADAVARTKELRKPPQVIAGNIIESEPIFIDRIIGYEDVSNSTRGNNNFIRLIAETNDLKIVAIDAMETGTIKEIPA